MDLGFRNGFTVGDGQLVRRPVGRPRSEHENIDVPAATTRWVDCNQKAPAALARGPPPKPSPEGRDLLYLGRFAS